MEYGAPILKFQKDLPDFSPSHWVMSYADGEYRIPYPDKVMSYTDGEYRIPNPTVVKTRRPRHQVKVKCPIPNPDQLMSYTDSEYRSSKNPAQVMSYADANTQPSTQRLLHNSPVHRTQTLLR